MAPHYVKRLYVIELVQSSAVFTEKGSRSSRGLEAAIEDAKRIEGVEYAATDVTEPDRVQGAVAVAAGAAVPLSTVVNCAGIWPSGHILASRASTTSLSTRRSSRST